VTPSNFYKDDIILLHSVVPCLSPSVFWHSGMGVLVIMVISGHRNLVHLWSSVLPGHWGWQRGGGGGGGWIVSLLAASKCINCVGKLILLLCAGSFICRVHFLSKCAFVIWFHVKDLPTITQINVFLPNCFCKLTNST